MFYNYRPDGLSEKGMHTPEPWKINHDDSTEEWSIVTNQHGSIVANVNEETGPELAGSIPVMRKMPGMENARRIVACVNACAGFTTEDLEAHTGPRLLHTRLKYAFCKIDGLLSERNSTGLAIDAAIRDGVVPEQHPLRSRLEMLANHRQREQELQAEVERVNNQINEMPGMDAFDEIDRLRIECGNLEMALGTVLATIPVKEVVMATGAVGDAAAYFKQLHQERDKLMAALQDARGALSSVNSGHQHQITVNDEPAYWQRGEWVRWILDEVLPEIETTINATKAE